MHRREPVKFVDKGAWPHLLLGRRVIPAPTEVPPGPSPDLTLEKALDSTLDRLLDLAAVTFQARG
jgi:hypothetical protein